MSNKIVAVVLGMLMSLVTNGPAWANLWSAGPYWTTSINNEEEFRANNSELFVTGHDRISTYNVCLLMWWIAQDNPEYMGSMRLRADQASQDAYILACRSHNRLPAWLSFAELRKIVQGRGLHQPAAGQVPASAHTPPVASETSPPALSPAAPREYANHPRPACPWCNPRDMKLLNFTIN